jgi:hypothetical protein
LARLRPLVNLWLACNERLVIQDRLHKFDIIDATAFAVLVKSNNILCLIVMKQKVFGGKL